MVEKSKISDFLGLREAISQWSLFLSESKDKEIQMRS
jgi:hypothetical protein